MGVKAELVQEFCFCACSHSNTVGKNLLPSFVFSMLYDFFPPHFLKLSWCGCVVSFNLCFIGPVGSCSVAGAVLWHGNDSGAGGALCMIDELQAKSSMGEHPTLSLRCFPPKFGSYSKNKWWHSKNIVNLTNSSKTKTPWFLGQDEVALELCFAKLTIVYPIFCIRFTFHDIQGCVWHLWTVRAASV